MGPSRKRLGTTDLDQESMRFMFGLANVETLEARHRKGL